MNLKALAKEVLDGTLKAADTVDNYLRILNTTRAYAEMSVPVAPGAKGFIRTIIPLHIIGLISVPFEPLKMGKSLYEIVKAPKWLKFLPMLKFGTSVGNVVDGFGTAIWICEQLEVSGIQVLSTVAVPLGGVALGLQALGIGVLSWRVYSIHNQWKGVKKAIGKQPTMAGYKAAVKLLTKPETKKEKYTDKFFGILTPSQKTTIQAIYKKAKTDPHALQQMDQTFNLLKKHHFQQKAQNGISIALMIIGAVGLTLVAFAPTPVAPIAWGIVAGVGTASIVLFGYGLYQNWQFNHALQNYYLK